jgi:hypothetical protein
MCKERKRLDANPRRYEYNTVARFSGQTAAEQRAVRREKARSRDRRR